MFSTDGVFLLVSFPPMPTLKASVSANAYFGIWQLAQLTVESLESIFSENNFFPSAALLAIWLSSFSKDEPIMVIEAAAIKERIILFIDTNVTSC